MLVTRGKGVQQGSGIKQNTFFKSTLCHGPLISCRNTRDCKESGARRQSQLLVFDHSSITELAPSRPYKPLKEGPEEGSEASVTRS